MTPTPPVHSDLIPWYCHRANYIFMREPAQAPHLCPLHGHPLSPLAFPGAIYLLLPGAGYCPACGLLRAPALPTLDPCPLCGHPIILPLFEQVLLC
jgi:hypothetical protein